MIAAGPANPALPDPVVGDSIDRVMAVLGRPNGKIELPDSFLLMFDRGNVMLSPQMVVTEVKLQPREQFQAEQDAENQQLAEAETTRVRSNALLDLLLSDNAYKVLATRDRVLALEKFNRDHPGSNAPQDIKDLLSVYQAEIVVQNHVIDLANQTKQAQSETDLLRKQVADDQKRFNELSAQVDRLQQQNAQVNSQVQAPPPVVPPPVYVVQQVPATPSGVVLTPANGIATPATPAPSPAPNNGSVPANPPTGVYQQLPNGTYQKISP